MGGKSSQTSTSSGPPSQFLQAYQQVLNQAQPIANAPLQQYPLGVSSSNVVSPLTSNQNYGIDTIAAMQGQYAPYLRQAYQNFYNASDPIQPLQFQGVGDLPGQGLSQFNAAGNAAAGLAGDVAPYTAAATAPINLAGYDTLSTYFNPYQQQVTDTTKALFNQQNAEAINQTKGNAAAQGAFGGDREAIAEAETARQQALAQDPVLAGIQQQGFSQAQQELNTQQQLQLQQQEAERQFALGAGQLTEGANLAGGQLALATGQGLLGEFNTQQQVGVGAQEATGWLNQGAGYGLANLGQENQNLGLAGAQAQIGAGGIQQNQMQQELNAPYEQFIQQQAYPFQTTGWLANIAEGLGGASGGTATTTYPGPSALGQIGGAGLAGVGALGASGAFGNNGWMSGLFGSGDPGLSTLATGTGADAQALIDSGQFIMPGAADGGRIVPRHRAIGGGLSAVPPDLRGNMAPGGIPDLSTSIVPGAHGLGDTPPPGGGGGLAKSFMQPVTTQTTTSGGGGILGDVLGIGKAAIGIAGLFDAGGAVPHGTYDDGGAVNPTSRTITLQVPDLSKSYIPAYQPSQSRTMGPPSAPPIPQQPANPLSQFDFKGLGKLFGGGDKPSEESLGGAVMPSDVPLQYDVGGPVPAQATAMGMAGASGPLQQRGLIQQFAGMSAEQLQELAMRYPATTPQGIAIARALQMKKMNPSSPGGASPAGPLGASGGAQQGTTAARGGRMGYDDGGDIVAHADLPPIPNDADEFGMEDYVPLARERVVAHADIPPLPVDKGAHADIPPLPTEPPPRKGVVAHADIPREESLSVPSSQARSPDISPDTAAILAEHESVDRPPFYSRARSFESLPSAPASDASPYAYGLAPEGRPFPASQNDVSGVTEMANPATVLPSVGLGSAHADIPPVLPTKIVAPALRTNGLGDAAYEAGTEDFVPPQGLATPSLNLPEVPHYGSAPSDVTVGAASDADLHTRYANENAAPQVGLAPAGPDAGRPTLTPPSAPSGLIPPPNAAFRDAVKAGVVKPHYTLGEMTELASMAGFSPDKAPIIAAIAMGESSGNPLAHNTKGRDDSYGLTQINALAHGPIAQEAANPLRAFQLAYQVSHGGSDFSPWSVYTSGVYRSYLQPGSVGAGGGPGVGVPGLGGPRGGPDRTAGPSEALTPAQIAGGQGATPAPPSPTGGNGLAGRYTPRDRESGITGFMNSPWMPLIATGAGMLASRSPFPGVALGEGLETGLKVAGQAQDRSNKAELADVRAQRVEDQAKHMSDLVDAAQKRLTLQQTLGEGNLGLKAQHNEDLSQHYQDQSAVAQAKLAVAKSDLERKQLADQMNYAARMAVATRPPPQLALLNAVMAQPNGPKTLEEAQALMKQVPSSPEARAKVEIAIAAEARQRTKLDEQAFTSNMNNMGRTFNEKDIYERHLQELRGAVSEAKTPGASAPAAAPATTQPIPGTPGAPAMPSWAVPGGVGQLNGKPIYSDGKGWFSVGQGGERVPLPAQ